MKLVEIQRIFHKELDVIYGDVEVDSFFYILIDFYNQLKRIDFNLNPDYKISTKEENLYLSSIRALKKAQPIQYITGEAYFYGLRFWVNEHVLIPRPETEELVDWILKEIKVCNLDKKKIRLIDIGTGSGCIAISLAKHLPKSEIVAIDISDQALDCASKNARLNKVNIELMEFDILKKSYTFLEADDQFDIIVSNPPYVRKSERTEMKPNVLNFEPHLALFVDDEDALQFYKHIVLFAKNNLKENGLLFFEINEYLGNELIAMMDTSEFNKIELKNDIFGKPRMIKGHISK